MIFWVTSSWQFLFAIKEWSRQKNIFFHISFRWIHLTWALNRGVMSHKSIHYLLDSGAINDESASSKFTLPTVAIWGTLDARVSNMKNRFTPLILCAGPTVYRFRNTDFWETFNVNFIYRQSFWVEICWEDRVGEIFFFHNFVLMTEDGIWWNSKLGFTSNKPTPY